MTVHKLMQFVNESPIIFNECNLLILVFIWKCWSILAIYIFVPEKLLLSITLTNMNIYIFY